MRLTTQTVYSKALAIYVALSFLLGIGVVSLTQTIIVREFHATERREMQGAVQRLQVLLGQEMEAVAKNLREWARWRTDGIVSSRDLQQLNFDYFAVLSADGHPVEVMINRLKSDPSAPLSEKQWMSSLMEEGASERQAYVVIQDHLGFASWLPNPPDHPEGSVALAVRLLGGAPLKFLETLLGGDFQFEVLRHAQVVLPGGEAILAMLSTDEIIVEAKSNDKIQARFLLRGPANEPLGIAKLTQNRPLEAGAAASVRVFLTVLVLASGVLFVVIWILLDRTILRRIRELTRQVEAEQAKGLLPVRLDFRGEDELGLLARRIESLALQLENMQSRYRQVVEDQTESICRFNEQFAALFSNAAFRRMFLGAAERIPTRLPECIPAEAMEFLNKKFQRLYANSPIVTFQHSIRLSSGRVVWFRSTLRRNFTPEGVSCGGQWVAADVTPQVEAERSVQESEHQLRQLSARLLHLQDEERRRIARELHDSTAQNLSALEMNVSLLDPLARDESSRRIVEETRRIARDCCQELRNISYLLHPPLLDEVGLLFALRWFVDGFVARTGIQAEMNVGDHFPRFDRDIETTIFRVVQEAASNIYRHSGATSARFKLDYDRQLGVTLSISDNGTGFPESGTGPSSGGIGLAGMRERIAQLGGEMRIQSSPQGVSLTIKIPKDPIHAKE